MRTLGAILALLTLGAWITVAAAQSSPDAGVRIVGTGQDALREVDAASRAGAGWVSIRVSWQRAEPSAPGSITTAAAAAHLDDVEMQVRRAAMRGMRVHLVIHDAPSWASGRNASDDPPRSENVPDYAVFLRSLTGRLGAWVDAYSPWNEPNIDGFWKGRDPENYTRLQQAAYRALKGGDRSAVVLTAPIAGGPINSYTYLRRLYEAGLRGHADAIAWTSYPGGAPESALAVRGRSHPSTLAGQLDLRAIIDLYDPGRRVWLTELGWSTCVPSCNANATTEVEQAAYLRRAFIYRRRYLANATERIFWFKARDEGADASRWENRLGIVRADFSDKPAATALRGVAARGGRARGASVGRVSVPTGAPGRVGLPSRASARRGRVVLDRLTVAAARARLSVSFRARVTGGPADVVVQAYDGNWVPVAEFRVPRASRVRARLPDKGYTAIRLLATPAGGSAPAAGLQRVVPLPRPAYRATASRRHRQLPARAAAVPRRAWTAPGLRITAARATLRNGRITARFGLSVGRGAWRVELQGYRNGRWAPLRRRGARRSGRLVVRVPDRGELGMRVRATRLDAPGAVATRLIPLPTRRPSA